MKMVSTVGLDIAKSVFQVHGVDEAGQVIIRRQLKRRHVLKCAIDSTEAQIPRNESAGCVTA